MDGLRYRIPVTDEVRRRIRSLRIEQGWTLEQFAERASFVIGEVVSAKTIAAQLRGERMSLPLEHVAMYANVLGVPVVELVPEFGDGVPAVAAALEKSGGQRAVAEVEAEVIGFLADRLARRGSN